MPRNRPPIIALNACPYCKAPIPPEPLPPGTSLGGCTACAHLVAARNAQSGEGIECGTLNYDWFHKHFDDKARKQIHAGQEKLLHGLGQWG